MQATIRLAKLVSVPQFKLRFDSRNRFLCSEGNLPTQVCRLCNESLESVAELRLHLLTQLHRDREKQIGYKQQ